MTIGFSTVFRRDPVHMLQAVGLVESAIAIGRPIVQLTDDVTPAVPGISDIRRLPSGPMYDLRLQHYIDCAASGDWLFVDTDCLLLADVADVFNSEFDIAVADRNWPGLPQGDTTLLTEPFNMGVVFTQMGKGAQFWRDVQTLWSKWPPEKKGWTEIQIAFYDVIRTGKYRMLILPGEIYNYPPRAPEDPCTGAKIAHYKGPERKVWLSERIRQSWQQSA